MTKVSANLFNRSLNGGENSFSSSAVERTFTHRPGISQSPSCNLNTRLSSDSASTPALPSACVSPTLKENAPPRPSTMVVTSVHNDVENVCSIVEYDIDDDNEEVNSDTDDDDALPDLTDPSWEAPSSHKGHKSNNDKIGKKFKTIDNSSFIKGRDPKLMKDARKVFKQKQKMFSTKPLIKSLSDAKHHERTQSAQDPKPSSDSSTSHSQLPSKVSADLVRAFIPHAPEPSPDDSEVEKRKAQIRDNILRAFPQYPVNKSIPTHKDNLVLHEEAEAYDEDNQDGFSIAVISDIQGNATSEFAGNCDADEKGYESDQTVAFEPPVQLDSDLLAERNDMQCTVTHPTPGKEFISKRKYDLSADEENRKKIKSSPAQPIALQKKEMVIIHTDISSHVSTVPCSGPKFNLVESIGREEVNHTGDSVPCNDLALSMTIPKKGDLKSRSKDQCDSLKTSTDEPVTPQAVGKSGIDMHPALTKLVWAKLNELTRKRKQCDEKIKQTWEEHNKKIAVLEELKAQYEKEIESLMNQHTEMDISQDSFRNQLTTDNCHSDGSQNNLQLESASVVEGELYCWSKVLCNFSNYICIHSQHFSVLN